MRHLQSELIPNKLKLSYVSVAVESLLELLKRYFDLNFWWLVFNRMCPCRVPVSCPSTCSWSGTQQRRSTSLATPVSTALDSATAPTTRASSSTQRPGPAGGVPLTSRAKLHSRWAPAIPLSSNAQTMIRSPLHPAESSQKRPPKTGLRLIEGW